MLLARDKDGRFSFNIFNIFYDLLYFLKRQSPCEHIMLMKSKDLLNNLLNLLAINSSLNHDRTVWI